MADNDAVIKILLQTAGRENLDELTDRLRKLEQELTADVKAFGRFDEASLASNDALKEKARVVADARKELADLEKAQIKLGDSTRITNTATIEMSRIFQDFFSGGGFQRPADAIRAISNNIEGMTRAAEKLSKIGFGSFLGSLMGPGGIIAGLTILSQLPWDSMIKGIGSFLDSGKAKLFNTEMERLESRLSEIKSKHGEIPVKFKVEAEQIEEQIKRLKAIREDFAREMGRQTKGEKEVGEVSRVAVWGTDEARRATVAAEAEYMQKAVKETGTTAMQGILKATIEQAEKELKAWAEGKMPMPMERVLETGGAKERAQEQLKAIEAVQRKAADTARNQFESLQKEMIGGVGESQELARQKFAEILKQSGQAQAQKMSELLTRAPSKTYAKFEEREFTSVLKEMEAMQVKRAEARHPELTIEAERRMFAGGAGPLVPDELKRSIATGLEAGLKEAGEKAPHEAARAISAKAAEGLEARFAAHPGLPLEEQRSKVEVDLTKAIAKLTGVEESKHPEMVLEAERRMLKAGAGPAVPEETRKSIAASLEEQLAKMGERVPGVAARMIAEKAGEGLEARFVARPGLPPEEQRRKVETDVTMAIAKLTGVSEKAKEAETKNRDIITTAQQEFFKQSQGGLKEITDQMRESVKQQTQQALIQRGVPIHQAAIASIGMMQEAERKFVDRLSGLGQLPAEERAKVVRKELEEAPAKEIKGRIEAQPRPAVEAAAERMFFELSKGDVDAITPKVMNAVAEFVEKTLRGLGEKGVAAKVSARELTEEAKKKLEGRFAEFEERPPAERAARVKEELEDIHGKFQGIEDRGGRVRQKQTSALETIYGSMRGEVEASLLQQGDPAEIAQALANKMVAERGATPAAARQASEKIVEDAWKQANISVQKFENAGMNTFQAVDAAMRELLQTMGKMANQMGQFRGQFMQHAQQARGMRQGEFGRPFQNH